MKTSATSLAADWDGACSIGQVLQSSALAVPVRLHSLLPVLQKQVQTAWVSSTVSQQNVNLFRPNCSVLEVESQGWRVLSRLDRRRLALCEGEKPAKAVYSGLFLNLLINHITHLKTNDLTS